MNETKLTKKAIKAIEDAFNSAVEMTKRDFYNKPFEDRKYADCYFHGVLESKLQALGIDISSTWDVLRDIQFHE